MSLYFSDLYVMIDFYVTESESCPVSQVYSLQPRAWTAKDFSTPPSLHSCHNIFRNSYSVHTPIHNVAIIILVMSLDEERCSFFFTFWMTFLIVECVIPNSSEISSYVLPFVLILTTSFSLGESPRGVGLQIIFFSGQSLPNLSGQETSSTCKTPSSMS